MGFLAARLLKTEWETTAAFLLQQLDPNCHHKSTGPAAAHALAHLKRQSSSWADSYTTKQSLCRCAQQRGQAQQPLQQQVHLAASHPHSTVPPPNTKKCRSSQRRKQHQLSVRTKVKLGPHSCWEVRGGDPPAEASTGNECCTIISDPSVYPFAGATRSTDSCAARVGLENLLLHPMFD
jgi:hypothetical protein